MTSESAKQELDDLDNLLKSPGWLRFKAYALQDADAQLRAELAKALENENDSVAAGRMRQVIAGQRTVERLVRWPQERLKALVPDPPSESTLPPSRRGAL